MKAELIKQVFDGDVGYKIKNISWCCNKLKDNPAIRFEVSDDANDEEWLEGSVPALAIYHSETIVSWGDELENEYYYHMQFCPFCGKPIEISIVDEKDVTEEYKKLEKQRKELWTECNKTDSKKREIELREKVQELDNKINWYYKLTDYDTYK